MTPKPKTVDEYILAFPVEVQLMLEEVRQAVSGAAPEAQETIKYGMPTYVYYGNLVYFAAFKNHIGFYPAPAGIPEFEKELKVFKHGKGSLQFPFAQPMPLELIAKVVRYYRRRNLKA